MRNLLWLATVIFLTFTHGVFAEEPLLQKALYAYYSGDTEKAASLYQVLIQKKPLDSLLHLDLAELYRENNQIERAIELLENLARKNQSPELKKRLSRLYLFNGNPRKALETLEKIHDTKPADTQILTLCALAYESLGDLKQSITFYKKILTYAPQEPFALLRLSELYLQTKDFENAEKTLNRLKAIDRTIPFINKNLGYAFYRLRKYNLSYEEFAKAAGMYPENQEIKTYLIEIKKIIGEDFLKAKKTIFGKQKQKLPPLVNFLPEWRSDPQVKVRIASDIRKLEFKCRGEFFIASNDAKIIFQGKSDTVYTLVYAANTLTLLEGNRIIRKIQLPCAIKTKLPNQTLGIFDITLNKGSFLYKNVNAIFRGSFMLHRSTSGFMLINLVSLEEYLYGVLAAEMPPSWPEEALKAQAVVARTFAMRHIIRSKKKPFNLEATIASQVYSGVGVEKNATNQAVDATRGQIITYNRQPIEALYHSNCGGHTRDNIFPTLCPYLTGVSDLKDTSFIFPLRPFHLMQWFQESPQAFCQKNDTADSTFRWVRTYTPQTLAAVANVVSKHKMPTITSLRIITRDKSGHVTALEITAGKERIILDSEMDIRKFFGDLRSSAFSIETIFLKKQPVLFILRGSGFGHGVGMCQHGAKKRAEDGHSFQEIIARYFPGTKIESIE